MAYEGTQHYCGAYVLTAGTEAPAHCPACGMPWEIGAGEVASKGQLAAEQAKDEPTTEDSTSVASY